MVEGSPTSSIATSDRPDFSHALYQAGAWFVMNPIGAPWLPGSPIDRWNIAVNEILAIRTRFARLLCLLLWVHVPLILVVSLGLDHAVTAPLTFAVILALTYHLTWWRTGIGPATRYVSAVALMGEPALLVYLLMGQSVAGGHAYVFSSPDWPCSLPGVTGGSLPSHLSPFYCTTSPSTFCLPFAVFPNGAEIGRVVFHGAVVALEGAVLIWLSNTLLSAFQRAERLSAEIPTS